MGHASTDRWEFVEEWGAGLGLKSCDKTENYMDSPWFQMLTERIISMQM